jgi:hypothetical protein
MGSSNSLSLLDLPKLSALICIAPCFLPSVAIRSTQSTQRFTAADELYSLAHQNRGTFVRVKWKIFTGPILRGPVLFIPLVATCQHCSRKSPLCFPFHMRIGHVTEGMHNCIVCAVSERRVIVYM